MTRAPARPVTSAAALVAVLLFFWPVTGVSATGVRPSSRPPAGVYASAQSAGAPPAEPVPSGGGPIVVEAQSPWVMSGQVFHLRLKIDAANPATDKIQVDAFSRLTTRSSFDNALAGRVGGVLKYAPVVIPLAQLQADPSGGYDIDIPVDPSGPTPHGPGSFPAFSAIGDSGVFPMQVGLYSAAGVPEGRPVTTFLVYAAAQGSVSGLPKLNVALVVPFVAPPAIGPHGEVQPVTATESSRLQRLAATLQANQAVPVSLAVSPQTVDALQAGSLTDRSTTLPSLESLRSSSDEILPATYARVSMGDLLGSGLGSELSAQFSTGGQALAKTFGAGFAGSTWVFDGPVDQATVATVLAHGASSLILPDGDLSPLSLAASQTTFALPTRLTGVTKGLGPDVYAADTLLTSDFDGPGGPVLAADHLLAELAMIQLETPGIPRGVAVVPPHRWSADTQFLDTLLGGLDGHPLLQPVTATGLFSPGTVKPSAVERSLAGAQARGGSGPGGGSGSGNASGSGQNANSSQSGGSGQSGSNSQSGGPGQSQGSGQTGGASLVGPPAGSLAAAAGAIREARRRVQAFQAVLTAQQQVGEQLGDALLVAESTDVTDSQRKAVIQAVRNGTRGALDAVTLPGSSSITLTSTKGQIPLTILSARGSRARVELRLRSQRLIFRAFNPPGGSCRVPTPTSEICDITVSGQNTTLKVPVEARSSGVFPLDVSLWTPGGALPLAERQNTVRSTAVSNVGLILIIVGVLSLLLWWGRDLHHGRRARRLVPPPHADETELRLDDPVVREFFANPPPGYKGGGAADGGETRTGGPRG